MNAAGFTAAKAHQTTASMSAIKFSFVWVPVIIYAVSLILMIVYRKWEKHEPIVKADLAKRNAEAEKTAE